jgi:hypothetical protein
VNGDVVIEPVAEIGEAPLIAPARVAEFPGCDQVFSIAMSPSPPSEKPVLYVHSMAPTVNLWPNVVRLWPELLGGVVGMVTLVAVFVAWRVWRRARRLERGKWYCRRCSYEIAGWPARAAGDRNGRAAEVAAAGRCPECGVELAKRRPVRGRAWVRRPVVLAVAAVWLVAAGGYGWMLVAELPRGGRAGRWMDWSSMWLVKYKDERLVRWLEPRVVQGQVVVAIELEMGGGKEMRPRVVTTRSRSSLMPIAASPDGAAIFLGRQDGTIRVVDARSGRLVREMSFPGVSFGGQRRPTIIGASPDGSVVYVHWHDPRQSKAGPRRSGVLGWEWRRGKTRELLVEHAASAPDESDVIRSDGRTEPPSYWLRDHGGRGGSPRFVSRVMPGWGRSPSVLSLHEEGRGSRRLEVDDLEVTRGMAMSPDGGSVYFVQSVLGRSEDRLHRVDLETGETISKVSFDGPLGEVRFAWSARGRWLVLVSEKGLVAYDTLKGEWGVRLSLPVGLWPRREDAMAAISSDGAWVTVACMNRATSQNVVALWDLGEHRLAEEGGTGLGAGNGR